MENKGNIASITINYSNGEKEEIFDSSIVLTLESETDEITVRAAQEITDELLVLICEQTAINISNQFLTEESTKKIQDFFDEYESHFFEEK